MSSIEAGKTPVRSIDFRYFKKLIEFNDLEIIETIGHLSKIQGFDVYNQLIDINSVFSNNPRFDPVDRTGNIQGPVKYYSVRPWQIPIQEILLEDALSQRVQQICSIGSTINILWSGGIDSTAIVTAFLQFATDLKKCRIIYTPWSTYEHPEFFKILKNRKDIELVDISGDFYLLHELDGIFISGNTGDEIHASIDESFIKQYGYDRLFMPWEDLFYAKIPNDRFIEFCKSYFALSGKDIKTVIEARWWFYTSNKLTSILNASDLAFFASGKNQFDPKRLIGFFDCNVYEQFIYFNLDRLMPTSNYSSWRQFLKDFCYKFDHLDEWRMNKTKFNSIQLGIYTRKKITLNDCRYLMILDSGEKITTPHLPFFSRRDWDAIKNEYQYVFQQPDMLQCTLA